MNTISTDEKTLTRFLLGDMPEAERERIESTLIFDKELHDRIAAVEFDLVDDYVRGRLTGPQLARFESYYLASPLNRERVRLAREFPDLQREHRTHKATVGQTGAHASQGQIAPSARPEDSASSGRTGFWLSVRLFIASLRPAAPYAFAGLLALVAIAGGWFLFGRNTGSPGGRGQIARVEPERPPSASATPAAEQPPAEPPGATPSPPPLIVRHQPTSSSTPTPLPPQRIERKGGTNPTAPRLSVVALALVAGLARSEGSANTLVVPLGTDIVRLDVTLPRQDYKSLRAEIQTVEGRRVWSGQVRRTTQAQGGRGASIIVPARLLAEDDYLLIITDGAAGGEEGRVESFYFKALRR
jgi:hypothetical protein